MFAMWRLHYAPLVIIQCVVIWSAEQRSQLSKSRVPSVCRPKSSRSPQGKRPVARDPRPGTAMRWGSTSGSSTCTVLLRPWSRSYPPVKYGYSLVLRTTILGQANYICCSPGWKSNVILEWSLVLQRERVERHIYTSRPATGAINPVVYSKWWYIDGFHSIFSLWQLEGKESCDVDSDQSVGSMMM